MTPDEARADQIRASLAKWTGTFPDAILRELSWLLVRLAAETAEVERLVVERLAFTDALGYGDGITEPAAELRDLVDPLSAALAVAREHDEACPVWCEDSDHDGQWERPRSCEHCKGSGYGGPLIQSVENVQGWTECEWCAGDGRDHREWRSNDELRASLAAATERADKVRAMHVSDRAESPFCEDCCQSWPCRTIRALGEVTG